MLSTKKLFLILLFAVAIITQSKAQHTTGEVSNEWRLELKVGVKSTDSRLFNFRDASIFEGQETFLNDRIANLNIARRIALVNQTSFWIGAGIQYSTSNFDRPFDHTLLDETDGARILRFLDTDSRLDALLTATVAHTLSSKWSAYILFQANNQIKRWIETRGDESITYRSDDVFFRSLEISPGTKCSIGNFSFLAQVRMMNIGKRDEVIFGRWILDDFYNKKVDFYNPLQFLLGVQYAINGRR